MTSMSMAREAIDLPQGAWAQGWRTLLRRDGRPILGFTQGTHRAYLYPVFSPDGYPVTSESPADHPHHNSVWIAADHVHASMPTGGTGADEATYNFYVNDVFQGRAPGRISETAIDGSPIGGDRYKVVQRLDWRGPSEWGADQGRVVAVETRTTAVGWVDEALAIDIESALSAGDWALTLGPTRHAWFGVRVAEGMTVNNGGALVDAHGRAGGGAVSGEDAAWIDLSGPVGGGRRAGIALFPDPGETWGPWFATDWGTAAVNPLAGTARNVAPGETVSFRLRLIVHDGIEREALAKVYKAYKTHGA